MIIDFIIQVLAASIFFLGIGGVGLWGVRNIFGLQSERTEFSLAVGYFFSLCFFVLFAVFGLFLFEDKREFLSAYTIGYGIVSLLVALRYARRIRWDIFFRSKIFWITAGSVLLSVFLFFLQVYHTSILDEWLHRPVVKSFIENGVFPLVNPIGPDTDFIHTYHYGVHIIGSAIELVFGLGISESLDIFKIANLIGILVLFYGVLRRWRVPNYWALAGAVGVIFLGSSFFLMDTFTASHIKRIGPFSSDWPSNAPLSFGLSGITSIGVLLTLTFFFVFTILLQEWRKIRISVCITTGFLFAGFMLLGEYHAILSLAYLFLFGGFLVFKKNIPSMVFIGTIAIVILVLVPSIYYSGGLGGALLNSLQSKFLEVSKVSTIEAGEIEGAGQDSSDNNRGSSVSAVMHEGKPAFALKSFSDWGFPSEKDIVRFFEKPGHYLRSFLLESLVVLFIFWLVIKRRVLFTLEERSLIVLSGFLVGVPFFITTAFGDLNLSKSVTIGIILLHLYFIKVLFHSDIRYKKYFSAVFLVLFLFGSLPGMALGSNIQWRWISSKGKSQYCSQNPLCYKGELVYVLREFDRKNPGFKRVVSDSGNVRKIADLTRAYVYIYEYGDIDSLLSQFGTIYIVNTPELDAVLSQSDREKINREAAISEQGEFKVVSLGKL